MPATASGCSRWVSPPWGRNRAPFGWEISNADLAGIDAILARHGAVTVPPDWLED
jgi:hypothetical protein